EGGSRGLCERQVAWLGGREVLVGVGGGAAGVVDEVRAVAHQAAGLRKSLGAAYRWQPMLERVGRDGARLLEQERISQDDGGSGAFFFHHGKGLLDLRYRA